MISRVRKAELEFPEKLSVLFGGSKHMQAPLSLHQVKLPKMGWSHAEPLQSVKSKFIPSFLCQKHEFKKQKSFYPCSVL